MKTKNRFGLFLSPDTGAGDGNPNADDKGTGLFEGGIKIGDALASVMPPAEKDPPAEKKEEVKPPVETKPPVVPQKPKLAHERFAELQEQRDKTQKEFEQAKTDWEKEKAAWESERKTLSTPRVPEDFQKQLETITAEKAQMEKDFQAVILQRQIQQEYSPKRAGMVEKLSTIAKAVGDNSIVSAISHWDYDTLAEFGESLRSPSQKRDWNRAVDAIQEIDEQISEKSKNIEGGWEELERKAQEQNVLAQRERVQRNVVTAESVYSRLTEAVPALKGAPELAKQVRESMIAMAGGEGNSRYTPEQVLQIVGEHPILNHICSQQTTKIKDLEKTLAEREETIKRLKPDFTHEHVEEESNGETVGTGLFGGGGLVVRRG